MTMSVITIKTVLVRKAEHADMFEVFRVFPTTVALLLSRRRLLTAEPFATPKTMRRLCELMFITR